MRELALRASHACAPTYTRFLEPPMEIACRAAANFAGCEVAFEGGYEGAERRMAGFYAGGAEALSFPIRRLRVDWNARYGSIGHRDILGALMGLGIERETLGDIAMLREGALLFVHEDIADYVAANLESCGRAKVRISPCGEEVAPPEPEGTLLYRTVPSQRLDAVLAAAYDLSRQKAQEMIRAELVKVDHAVETRADARLEAGSLVSARGLGRFRVQEVAGLTRKGRVGLRLFVYGK
ncbi:MAG TPA: hypothetical protein IAA71_01545 [Candidatus Pullichristensenella stercoripullorum]|nr:hypothetical protein [Candidatus Pullichristensenella stercoripullorum]